MFDEEHFDLLRFLLTAEMVEVFEAVQAMDWDCARVNGEALSRVLAAQRYPTQLELPRLGVRFTTVHSWLDSDRPDYINHNDGADTDPVAVGCGVLFLHWLNTQLGYAWDAIVRNGAATLAGTYEKLTGSAWNAFDQLAAAAAEHYPQRGWSYGLAGDNPFLGWQSAGAGPGSPGGAGSPGPYQIDVFGRDAKMSLYHRWYDGAVWSPPQHWENVGYQLAAEPAVVFRDGRPELFGPGVDGQVHWIYWDIASGTWLDVPLGLPSTLKVAACGWEHEIDLFAVKSDNSTSLWHCRHDGSFWGGWEDLGLPGCQSPPSAVRWFDHADVAVVSSTPSVSPAVCHRNLGKSTWDVLAGVTVAFGTGPEIVSWGPPRLDIFVRDDTNQLRQRYYDGDSWGSKWGDAIAAGLTSTPRATASAPSRIDVVWTSADGVVYHEFWDGDSWGTPLSMQLATAGPVIPVSRGSGMLDLIAAGTDRIVYHNRWA